MKLKMLPILFALISLLLFGCNDAQMLSVDETGSAEGGTHMSLDAYSHIYAEILEDYEKIVDFRLSDGFENDWNGGKDVGLSSTLLAAKYDEFENRATHGNTLDLKWNYMLADMTDGLNAAEKSSFGYILQDLNEDAVPELFWIRNDGVILAVFTIRNNEPILLDAFWPRYKCVITDNGELYTFSSGGTFYSSYDIRKLTSTGELTLITSFGLDGGTSESGVQYYEVVDGAKVAIEEMRFNSLLVEYPFVSGTKWSKTEISFLHI